MQKKQIMQNNIEVMLSTLQQIKTKLKLIQQKQSSNKYQLNMIYKKADDINVRYTSSPEDENIKQINQSGKISISDSRSSIKIVIPQDQILIGNNIVQNIQLQNQIFLSNQDINEKTIKSFHSKSVIQNGIYSSQNPLLIFTFALIYFFQKYDIQSLINFKNYIIQSDMSRIKNIERFQKLQIQLAQNQIDIIRMKKFFLIYYRLLADKQSPFSIFEKYTFFDYISQGFLRAYLIQKLNNQEKIYQQIVINSSQIQNFQSIYKILARLFELQYSSDEDYQVYTFKNFQNNQFIISKKDKYFQTNVDQEE